MKRPAQRVLRRARRIH